MSSDLPLATDAGSGLGTGGGDAPPAPTEELPRVEDGKSSQVPPVCGVNDNDGMSDSYDVKEEDDGDDDDAPNDGVVELDDQIKTQIEFYFGEDNYRHDRFLRSQEDSERWVKIEALCSFRKIKDLVGSLDVTPELLQTAVGDSHVVETRRIGDMLMIRRCVPLEDLAVDSRSPDERVAEVVELFKTIAAEASEQGANAVFLQAPLNHLIGLTRFVTGRLDPRCTADHAVLLLDCYTLVSTVIAVVSDVMLRASYIRHISAFATAAINDSTIAIPPNRLRQFQTEVRAMKRRQDELRRDLDCLRMAARAPLSGRDANDLTAKVNAEIAAIIEPLADEDDAAAASSNDTGPKLALSPRKEAVRLQLENLFRANGRAGWDTCALLPYGSSVTGLGTLASDIDIALVVDTAAEVPRSGMDPDSFPAGAITLMKSIADADPAWCNIDAIPAARVPIIKLTHAKTGFECDVCVNQTLSAHNSLLLKVYSCLDARVRPLVVVIKQWAKRRGVADASNGTLSAYAWANLVVFFLQQPLFKTASGGRLQPILPNVQSEKLINAARVALGDAIACPGSGPNTVDGFDVSFCHDISTIRAMYPDAQSRGGTVGELLDGFFRFYAFDFNWENHVVSIRRSPRKLTKQNANKMMPRPRQWRLSIEDPFESPHDLGMVIFSPGVNAVILHELQQACRHIRDMRRGGLDKWWAPTAAWSKGEPECVNCGVLGHVLSRCPKLGRDKPRHAAPETTTVTSLRVDTAGSGGEDAAVDTDAPDAVDADAANHSPEEEVQPPKGRRARPDYEKFAELCFLCGESNHSSRRCPKKKQQQGGRGKPQSRAMQCFLCGRGGHLKRDCPDAAGFQRGPTAPRAQDSGARASHRQPSESASQAAGLCSRCGEQSHRKRSDCPNAHVLGSLKDRLTHHPKTATPASGVQRASDTTIIPSKSIRKGKRSATRPNHAKSEAAQANAEANNTDQYMCLGCQKGFPKWGKLCRHWAAADEHAPLCTESSIEACRVRSGQNSGNAAAASSRPVQSGQRIRKQDICTERHEDTHTHIPAQPHVGNKAGSAAAVMPTKTGRRQRKKVQQRPHEAPPQPSEDGQGGASGCGSGAKPPLPMLMCSACGKTRVVSAFSNAQKRKPSGTGRCRQCSPKQYTKPAAPRPVRDTHDA